MVDRPLVSGSMAGHCRMNIWLSAQGREAEPPLPHVQRTFDIGNTFEKLLFDGDQVYDEVTGEKVGIPAWWKSQDIEIVDYSTGEAFHTRDYEVQDRQLEVVVDGFVGHLDGIMGPSEFVVLDAKTAPSRTWDKNLKGDLLLNPFSREYVLQMQFYIEGARIQHPGLGIERAALIYINKENSKIMARFVPRNEELLKEVKERLSWAKSTKEPLPDWVWEKGERIPLRCGYCNLRQGCAEVRGQSIQLQVERGEPKWYVS